VVRQAQQHCQVLLEVCTTAQACGFGVRGGIRSPLLGPKGNREFLLHLHTAAALLPAAALQHLCTQLSLPTHAPSS
jgi:23S rRNA (cytidine1920-2'-O)/16S rRNA (cytidine1409-2'-O)-methyltransferase